MPKQSRRIAVRQSELARRKKGHRHVAPVATTPTASVATPAASRAAPATAVAAAPARQSSPSQTTAKGARQILTPNVRYLKSDFLTLALLTGIVVAVLIVLKVLENQGLILR